MKKKRAAAMAVITSETKSSGSIPPEVRFAGNKVYYICRWIKVFGLCGTEDEPGEFGGLWVSPMPDSHEGPFEKVGGEVEVFIDYAPGASVTVTMQRGENDRLSFKKLVFNFTNPVTGEPKLVTIDGFALKGLLTCKEADWKITMSVVKPALEGKVQSLVA